MSWRSILSRSLNYSVFDSLFCVKLIPHACEKDKLPVNPELVQDLLLQLDLSKSMGLMGFIQEYSESWMVSSKDLSQ